MRACENESSRSDARSKNWPLRAHIPGLSMSVCLQNCTENIVSIVTDYVTHCYPLQARLQGCVPAPNYCYCPLACVELHAVLARVV